MKKTIFTLLAAVACSVTAWAGIDTVVVTAGGESTNIALNEKPVVTVTADALVITTSDATYTYETDQEVVFSFADSAGIESIVADKATPTFYFDNNTLRVYNLEANAPIALYGINGMVYFQGRADREGNAEIDLSSYRGVIIVNTPNKTIKINKK